jgi:hypothetical protein
VAVDLRDLLDALEFVSFDGASAKAAFLCKETGQINSAV